MLKALYKKKKTTRFDVLLTIVVIIFAILLGRVFYLQAIEGDYYRGKAEGNRLRMLSMTATRGLMYDRNGQIVVGSRPAYMVSMLPTGKQADPKELEQLASYLQIPVKTLAEKIEAHKGGYEPIRLASDVTLDKVTKIEEHRHELPGITVDVEPLRYYPHDTMASQLLG